MHIAFNVNFDLHLKDSKNLRISISSAFINFESSSLLDNLGKALLSLLRKTANCLKLRLFGFFMLLLMQLFFITRAWKGKALEITAHSVASIISGVRAISAPSISTLKSSIVDSKRLKLSL